MVVCGTRCRKQDLLVATPTLFANGPNKPKMVHHILEIQDQWKSGTLSQRTRPVTKDIARTPQRPPMLLFYLCVFFSHTLSVEHLVKPARGI